MSDPRTRAGWERLRAVFRLARTFVLRSTGRLALGLLLLLGMFSGAGPLLGPTAALATEDPDTPVRVRGSASDAEDGEAVSGRRTPDALPVETPEPAPTAGEVIVGTALAYVGYPYVSGGNSPAGFDCSGFTQYVILLALGIDIGHGLPGQTGAGAWIEWGAWQPGDLVFFANTYKAGLSHVGIYVGDGLFVHAGSEATGVLVSSMYEEYYASRYYGAVRVSFGG